jgi:hypothetical protein
MVEHFKITYDNLVGDVFHINTPKGILKFQQMSKNLYLYIPGTTGATNLLNTVEENKVFYTHRQIERAKAVQALLRAIGCPSNADLRAIIRMNSIKDCPVVEGDIKLAEAIFGKDVAILKGKTIRKKLVPVVHNTVKIPRELVQAQYEVTVAIDTFL